MRALTAVFGRRAHVICVLASLIALLAGLAIPVGTPSAAAVPTARTSAARTSAAKAASEVRPATPQAGAARRTQRAAAARQAIAAASVPDTCSGAIAPDTIYPCTTPSGTGTDTFTLALTPGPSDMLFVRILSASGNALNIAITAPDNSAVPCTVPIQLYQCAISQTGTYTLAVTNRGSSYTLEYTTLLAEGTCPAIDPSFAAAPRHGSLVAGQTGDCYGLSMTSGTVVHDNSDSTPNSITVGIFDATGAPVCIVDSGTCTLTGTAPYRVFVSAFYGNAQTYDVALNSITNPAGCAAAVQVGYGQVPDTSSSNPCRTITVATSDNYQVSVVGSANPAPNSALYTVSGATACDLSAPYCQLAPGTYDYVASEFPDAFADFGLSFIAADEARGCAATVDTGFAAGPATGRFSGTGEEICLTLPTAAGKTDYFFDQTAADGSVAQVLRIVDATGAQPCLTVNGAVRYATCTLTGTAPFRAILADPNPTGGYRLLVNRTDSSAGCAVWPRSGFGGSWGATATLTLASNVKCLSIPAGQHSTGEMIDYSNIANVVDGAIYVNDPAGSQACLGNSTSICAFKTGVNYTALMITTAVKGDTYHMVRRDVSQTASCARPASTMAGGPSTTFTLTSDLDTFCYRVTAAAADKLVFNARSRAPSPAGAVLQVTNAAGALVCRQFGNAYCMVTGKTDYQVLVTASGYSGVAITTHLDTWLVGTAAGWAARCESRHLSASGIWGPISGTLTERAAGLCAVVDGLKPDQFFDVFGTDTAAFPDAAYLNIFTPADWTGQLINGGMCSGSFGAFDFTCSTTQEMQPIGQGLLLLTAGNSPNPTGFTMQGVCKSSCAAPPHTATLTAVTPSRQPTGPNRTVVVTGAGLNLGTQFELASNGLPATSVPMAFPQSVNPAGTRLTLLLNTAGIPPGKYDVVLDSAGYTTGTPSPGYLPGGYTITPGPVTPPPSHFVPLRPARILNTMTGLGARKARIAAGGTVALKATGVGGVPVKAVTAIALEVTAAGPAAAGHLVAYPFGAARPGVTDVSFAADHTMTNLAVVPVRDGKIDLYNASKGKLDLTADVTGYFTTGAGSVFTAAGPSRILDTRSGLGARKARVGGRSTITVKVAGAGGVPAKGVTAVALDVTGIRPAAAGHLVAYASGTARPGVTDVSFAAGQTVTGLVVVPVRGGAISLYNTSHGALDLTADAVGYYSSSGRGFEPAGLRRILDTRTGLGSSGETVLPHAAALMRLSSLPELSLGESALVLNVTVASAQHGGTLTVFADGQPLPVEPNLAFSAGQTVSNLVIVPPGDGSIDFYNGSSGNIQVIADLKGFYTA